MDILRASSLPSLSSLAQLILHVKYSYLKVLELQSITVSTPSCIVSLFNHLSQMLVSLGESPVYRPVKLEIFFFFFVPWYYKSKMQGIKFLFMGHRDQ